jgi:zinc/manganese transport system permease protein
VLQSILIYAFIAIALHFVYPKLNGFLRELVFFSLLAITVTSSVSLSGVFVVFVLLIAPPFVAISLNVKRGLLSSFIFGWFFSIGAFVISYFYDLPTGYSIVFMGAFLTVAIVLIASKSEQRK